MEEQPKKSKTGLYIAIGIAIFICCCCVAAIALYLNYDKMGDPLGIYGALPQIKTFLFA